MSFTKDWIFTLKKPTGTANETKSWLAEFLTQLENPTADPLVYVDESRRERDNYGLLVERGMILGFEIRATAGTYD